GRLVPRYSLAGNFGRDEYVATLGLLAEQSSDERLSNRRQDKSRSLLWGHAFDTGTLRISARTDEASTRATEFEDSGLVSRESTRRSYSANLNGQKELSERTSLNFGASHAGARYEDTALSNYSNQTAEVGLGYAVSESLSATARLAATVFDPDGSGVPSKSYSLSFGVSAQSGERFNWAAQYGLRRTIADTESNGSDGLLSLQWNGATNDFSFVVSRQYSPSSVGLVSIVDSVKGAWQSQWGPSTRTLADFSLTKRHGELETRMAQATAAFIYDTSAVSSVRVYVQEKRLDQANSVVTASIIGSSLSYNWRP
ncbi:MAG TPA: hypothetical protein VFH31_14960, partial [Pyrinomonadaceae bacterium]|nr:hypothetical protein [Pyrinomonadaceae bacterium]